MTSQQKDLAQREIELAQDEFDILIKKFNFRLQNTKPEIDIAGIRMAINLLREEFTRWRAVL